MVIDQTKSFFVDSRGNSTSYYDPTVRTETTTDMSSRSAGGSVNLGAIGGALGIGGTLGGLLGGINLGGSGTSGTSTSNTTYFADQPQISIAPYGSGVMSKSFTVPGIFSFGTRNTINTPMKDSDCKFSICISYSSDEGQTFQKLVTDFYTNSFVQVPIRNNGKINAALAEIYQIKPDALREPIWLIWPQSNYYSSSRGTSNSTTSPGSDGPGKSIITNGVIYDYQ